MRLRPATLLLSVWSLLVIPAGLRADVAYSPPYRRPDELQQPVSATTQAHLDAAQHALQLALDQLSKMGGPSQFRMVTIPYGGYIARAREDLVMAISLTATATAYVQAHPESNVLATGPVPANEPKAPPLPLINNNPLIGSNLLVEAVDAVHVAVADLLNSPQHDQQLGDIGGLRGQLIAILAQIGNDLSNGVAYNMRIADGDTGIIPLTKPDQVPADPKYGPSARIEVAEVGQGLATLRQILAVAGSNYHGDRTEGGYVPRVKADLQRTATDLMAALAYLATHPEANALSGPARPEPSETQVIGVPYFAPRLIRGDGSKLAQQQAVLPPLTADTISTLNTLITALQNPQRGTSELNPILGDLGGYRKKILDDLGRAQADTLAGILFTAGEGPAAPPS